MPIPFRIPHFRFRALLLLAVIGTAALRAGPPAVPGIDPEANRKLLQEMRETEPEQYARLVRNFELFRVLPPEQQENLRHLDRQIHEEDSATQARLRRVLGEYNSWLSRLHEADRQRIEAATTSEERLRIVRELREREWLESLPAAQREQWVKAPLAERKKLSERWKQEERDRREEWADAGRWQALAQERPMAALGQEAFRRELTTFVEKRLLPMLSPEEKNRIWSGEGPARRAPFAWLRSVAELCERHPVLALEPKYLHRAELPAEYQKALNAPPRPGAATAVSRLPEGKWPEYPIAVTRLLRNWNVPVKAQLGPATAKEFSPAVEDFVATRLSSTEREKLKKSESKWPDYPLALHEIAREKKLALPDLDPPGDPRFWESVRNRPAGALPDPPPHLLFKFALELNQKDTEGRHLSLQNPADREVIKRLFFDKHPEMLEKLKQQDRSKFEKKGMKP